MKPSAELFVVLGAVLAAAASAHAGAPAPKLPEGRLLLVSGSRNGAFFLVVDESAKRGDVVTASLYQVFDPPIQVSARASVQGVARETIVCSNATYT